MTKKYVITNLDNLLQAEVKEVELDPMGEDPYKDREVYYDEYILALSALRHMLIDNRLLILDQSNKLRELASEYLQKALHLNKLKEASTND